jgi:hypothetical protein
VREAQPGLIVFAGDVEDDVRAVPLRFFFDKVDLAVDDVPPNFLTRREFRDFCALR